jgi:carboxyl-terminal processing protease
VGFRAGDEVVEIDGYDVRGYSPRYVMWKTRAESGGGIRIAVERKGEAEPVLIEADHGVTLTVKRPQGRLTVKSPLRGTPAYLGGVLAEDVIATVDGDPTDDWTLDQAVRNITGPPGTAVTLGIERRGEPDLIDKTIKRAEIEIESIKGWRLKGDDTWDFFVDRGRRIGYIRLSQFIPQSSDDMNRAINQMDDGEGLEGLILDLRFNPGGLLNKAVDVTNAFVKTGLIVSTVDADGKVTDPRRASPDRTHRDFPMVVLINQGSASASEIVSGALQDHGRATVVGTRSFGKGSVQDLYPIDRGHALLKLTTHHYRLPLNRIIHREPDSTRWGIEPNLIVEMSDDQVREALKRRQNLDVLRRRDEADAGGEDPQNILDEGLDPQLEVALLLLKAKAVARNLMFAGHSTAPQAPGDPGRYATKRPGS